MNANPLQTIVDRLYALGCRIDRFDGEYASTDALRDECSAIASDLLRLTPALPVCVPTF